MKVYPPAPLKLTVPAVNGPETRYERESPSGSSTFSEPLTAPRTGSGVPTVGEPVAIGAVLPRIMDVSVRSRSSVVLVV